MENLNIMNNPLSPGVKLPLSDEIPNQFNIPKYHKLLGKLSICFILCSNKHVLLCELSCEMFKIK